MLKRVRIKGYKSLLDVDVTLQPLTVLVGPNASGKSNFLDALQLLSRMATARKLREAFEPPYRGKVLESFSFGAGGIPELLQQDRLRFTIEVDIEPDPALVETLDAEVVDIHPDQTTNYRFIRYSVSIEMQPQAGVLRVAEEYVIPYSESPTSAPYFLVGSDKDYLNVSRAFASRQQKLLRILYHEFERWHFFYLEPRERMRVSSPVKEIHQIGMMGEELAPFLNTLKFLNPAQFDAIEKALNMIIPSIERIDVEVNNVGEVELRLIENGIAVPSRVVSDGTLRILGLLALQGVRETVSLVGFEEPENGVHPYQIQLLANLLETGTYLNTQFIVTTHSPILLDLIAPEALFICRKTSRGTEIIPYTDSNKFIPPLDDESDEFVSSIGDRIQRGDFNA
jgi:predicted ATPase